MEREGFQMNTIAERIKFAMKAKNKKQVDIVKDTGISKGVNIVSRLEVIIPVKSSLIHSSIASKI